MSYVDSNLKRKVDKLQRVFLWLILIDYALLIAFLTQIESLHLTISTIVSALLVVYNILLSHLCFKRANRRSDSYIIYPISLILAK